MYKKITISGLICTGKTTLFNALVKQLGWSSFSASCFFRQYARTHQLSLENAEEQNDKLTKEVDFKTRDLLKSKKNYIIEGWMAGIMADEFGDVLRILLVCKDNIRIYRFAKRDNISTALAKQRIREREQNLFQALEKIYKRRDFVDPKNYNCIIDTTRITEEQVIDRVLEKLGYPS